MWNRLRELLENNRGPSRLEYKMKAWLVSAYFNIGAVIGVIAALVTVYQIGYYFLANAHGNADIFYGLLLTVMLSLVAAAARWCSYLLPMGHPTSVLPRRVVAEWSMRTITRKVNHDNQAGNSHALPVSSWRVC